MRLPVFTRVWVLIMLASGGGTAQTLSNPPDLSPVDVDLVRPLIAEGRWIWMGDSYAVPYRLRVPFATLVTWPLSHVGAVSVGPKSPLGRQVPAEIQPQVVADGNGFVLAAGTPMEDRMGLPLYQMLEWDLPAGDSDLGRMYLGFSYLLDGYAALDGTPFNGPTEARPLVYTRPGAASPSRLRYSDTSETPSPRLVGDADGFALGEGTAIETSRDRLVPLRVSLDVPEVVHLAGTVIAGEPGHYAQFLGDESWSYWGFSSDADPVPDSLKRFRTDDLAGYLAATTLDPAQPSVVAIHLAHERRPEALLRTTLERMVAQTRDAFDRAGLGAPVILFVHPQAIDTAIIDTAEKNERNGVVMREMALADDRIAFVSLYDATDGVVFDGRPEARAWLEASPYASFCFGSRCRGRAVELLAESGGNLLDARRLHTTEHGALFFSALLGELLTGRPVACDCPTEPPPASGLLFPNPIRTGDWVSGALPDEPVYDARGRRVGRTDPAGRFVAPSVPGVYLVGGARLVVQ